MRLSTLLFFEIITVLNVWCQPDSIHVPVAAKWNAGDHYDFSVTKIKHTVKNQIQLQNDTLRYKARFIVEQADSASFLIKWSFRNPYFNEFRLPVSSQKKLSRYETCEIIYKTDQYGAFEGIENWKEVGQMMVDLMHEFIQVKSEDTTIKIEQLKKSLEPLMSVYKTRRGVEQLLFKELSMFHFPLGKQFTTGKVYHYTEKVPVLRNFRPITGNGTIYIRHYKPEEQRCEIFQRMKIPVDSVALYLYDYYLETGVKKEAILNTISNSILDVRDENIFDYLLKPGIPVKVTVWRESDILMSDDRIRQTDETIIEKIE